MNLFLPKKLNVLIFIVSAVLVILLVYLPNWQKNPSVLITNAASLLLFIFLFLPFNALKYTGLDVGYFGEYFGFPNLNALGYLLVLSIDIIALYILASLLSFFIRKLRSSPNESQSWT